MAVSCTNLAVAYDDTDYSSGRCYFKWKCAASGIDHFEVLAGYYSAKQKTWVQDDSAMNADTNNVDGVFQQHWTAPEATVAVEVRFYVRPVLKRTTTDDKGNEKTYDEYGTWQVSSAVKNPRWLADQDQQREFKYKFQTVRPDAPTIAIVSSTSTQVVLGFRATSPRVGSIEIQRRTDGGAWGTLAYKDRAFGSTQAPYIDHDPWPIVGTTNYTDKTIQAGHTYEYRARCLNTSEQYITNISGSSKTYTFNGYEPKNDVTTARFDGPYGEFSNDSVSIVMLPVRPQFDKAELAGPSSVKLWWIDGGKNTSEYDIQYSSYRSSTGQNAWNAGALEAISHMTVPYPAQQETMDGTRYSVATVTGLNYGTLYDFRVYSKNAQGEAVSIFVASDGKSYGTRSVRIPAEPAPTFAIPTGFSGSKTTISGDVAVIFSWTDVATLETGAAYVVEHSTYADAWKNNAGELINDSGDLHDIDVAYSGKSKRYTWPNIEGGKTHYFKLLKKMDGSTSKYADGTVKIEVAATTEPTLTAPTWGSVTSRDGGRALVTFNGSALGSGESFQIQYTDYSLAFSENSEGDIRESSLNESSGATHSATISDLDPGDWWFRIRRRSETDVSNWTSTKKLSVPALSSGVLKQPRSLKVAYSNGTITLTWDDDILETGASYVIEHAIRSDAWTLNVASAIDDTDTNGDFDGRSGARRKHSFEDVDTGVTHYYRLFKVKEDAERVEASNGMQAVVVPAISESLDPPTNLVASVVNGRFVLTWDSRTMLASGESFQVQYADYPEAFELNDLENIEETALEESAGTSHVITLSKAEGGRSWWARVRRRSDEAVSAWVGLVTVELPPSAGQLDTENLGAPTPTTTSMAYMLDEDILLSWIHNSGSNSQQTAWQVEVGLPDGTAATMTGDGQLGESPSTYITPDDLGLVDGDVATWRVRTQGVWPGYWSPWSKSQSFNVYSRPVATIGLSQNPLTSLPLAITVDALSQGGESMPAGNRPIMCALTISAVDDVESTYPDGSIRYIAAGEEVWSGFYDAESDEYVQDGWEVSLDASDVTLSGAATYRVRATVSTMMGMRCEAETDLTCEWEMEVPPPRCSTYFDAATLSCTIYPWCEELVGFDPETGDQLFDLRDDTVLSVYRVNQDGSTELVAEGLENDGAASCVDPRCAFGTCTYRIVARDTETGAQGANDYIVQSGYQRVVVDFGADSVELKYNIEWTEDHNPDVEFLNFHGRSNPVAHWGTQRGHKAHIKASLIKGTDEQTLSKLRQLADYRGACYVREPTGLAWWASVVPKQMSGGYLTREQQVELDVTRIEA